MYYVKKKDKSNRKCIDWCLEKHEYSVNTNSDVWLYMSWKSKQGYKIYPLKQWMEDISYCKRLIFNDILCYYHIISTIVTIQDTIVQAKDFVACKVY